MLAEDLFQHQACSEQVRTFPAQKRNYKLISNEEIETSS